MTTTNDTRQDITLGLSASYFFRTGPDADRAIGAIFDDYVERWGSHLKIFIDDDTHRYRPFGKREAAYPSRRLKNPSGSVYFDASGAAKENSADWWWLEGASGRWDRQPGALSGIAISVHPGTPIEEFLPFALESADQGAFFHGWGGFAMILPIDYAASQRGKDIVRPWALRYTGFDVPTFASNCTDATDGLVLTGWLTLVGEELLGQLGGRDALRSKLSSDIILHERAGGLVIQAGPQPVSGDVNGPDELGPYREVSEALKPIFSNGGGYGAYRDMPPLGEDTRAWRYRFCKGTKWPP